MMRLPVVTSISDSWLLPLLVMLTSLREHLRTGVEPVLYLLHRGLRADTLAAIGGIVETRPIRFDSDPLEPFQGRHLPPEAMSPLLIADLVADERRVLFVDADLLVLDDVATLWDIDLDGRALAAVRDTVIPWCRSARGVKNQAERGVPEHASYFNAGVMLMDLDAWRQRDVTARALDYLKTTDRVDLLHQEALNAENWDDWLELPPRWNLLAGVAGRPFAAPDGDAWRHPGIVHFAGRLKPWRMAIGGRFGGRYGAVLERVVHMAPPAPRTWKESFYGFYDRRLRNFLYPLEYLLWSRRMF